MTYQTKINKKKGHEAVMKILDNLRSKNEIMKLIVEFDESKTKEALFAHYCDKLEADIQSKLYDEEGCVDLNNQEGNKILSDPVVNELLKTGKSWSEMWLIFGQRKYNYDEHFKEVSNYVINNDIKKFTK